jgi:hypothetical protein
LEGHEEQEEKLKPTLMPSKILLRWLSKKRQMQGAQLSRNEAYYDYAAVTRAIAATQQLVSFCDAITIDGLRLVDYIGWTADNRPGRISAWRSEIRSSRRRNLCCFETNAMLAIIGRCLN